MDKLYMVNNCGCDDTTKCIIKISEEQFKFLNNVLGEINKYSSYGCMPKIYIKEYTTESNNWDNGEIKDLLDCGDDKECFQLIDGKYYKYYYIN
jgi:hypothetical protein